MEEFRSAMTDMGISLSPSEVKTIFARFDTICGSDLNADKAGQDGYLNWKEFVSFYQNYISSNSGGTSSSNGGGTGGRDVSVLRVLEEMRAKLFPLIAKMKQFGIASLPALELYEKAVRTQADAALAGAHAALASASAAPLPKDSGTVLEAKDSTTSGHETHEEKFSTEPTKVRTHICV
jgi:hypothetical protein